MSHPKHEAIQALLDVLPDSTHEDERDDEMWGWCWNELDGEAQEAVTAARRQGLAALEEA